MKRYSYWIIVLTAAGIALLAAFWRYGDPVQYAYRLYTERVVGYTLELLEDDPTVQFDETRACVRLVAASAETGHLNSPEALYILALQYERENNPEAAETWLCEAIARAPEWSWPYVTLGILLARTGQNRLEEAAELLDTAIALQPDWVRPYNSLSAVLRMLGRLEEAEAMAVKAVELAPEDVAAHNNYANVLSALGRYEEAETHYRYAMDSAPDNPKPPYNLACLFSAQGREEEALEYLAIAMSLDKDVRYDAAIDPYFEAMRSDPAFRELVFAEPPSEEGEIQAEGENSNDPETIPHDAR